MKCRQALLNPGAKDTRLESRVPTVKSGRSPRSQFQQIFQQKQSKGTHDRIHCSGNFERFEDHPLEHYKTCSRAWRSADCQVDLLSPKSAIALNECDRILRTSCHKPMAVKLCKPFLIAISFCFSVPRSMLQYSSFRTPTPCTWLKFVSHLVKITLKPILHFQTRS